MSYFLLHIYDFNYFLVYKQVYINVADISDRDVSWATWSLFPTFLGSYMSMILPYISKRSWLR